jgi:hypothetical protein
VPLVDSGAGSERESGEGWDEEECDKSQPCPPSHTQPQHAPVPAANRHRGAQVGRDGRLRVDV